MSRVLDLEHYLDVLQHKPDAFAGSKPLEQWRRAGRWPTSYDQFWNGLIERHGRQHGTRAMIELLQLGRDSALRVCGRVIESALQLGCAELPRTRRADRVHRRFWDGQDPSALSALCVAACRQRGRVRFTTAAGLVNEAPSRLPAVAE